MSSMSMQKSCFSISSQIAAKGYYKKFGYQFDNTPHFLSPVQPSYIIGYSYLKLIHFPYQIHCGHQAGLDHTKGSPDRLCGTVSPRNGEGDFLHIYEENLCTKCMEAC